MKASIIKDNDTLNTLLLGVLSEGFEILFNLLSFTSTFK
jgi:hypothetical protein